MSTIPNFLIIGAPKSGTTSIYSYLKQHPDIYLPENKEPKFFSFENSPLNFRGPSKAIEQIKKTTIISWNEYLKLFEKADCYKARGEASPIYLHFPGTTERISKYLPDAKLIAILRNPVERLYSDWRHQVRMGYEPEKNFLKAIAKSEKRQKNNWIPYLNYIPKGYYYNHISRYLKFFPKEQLKIFLYEDLCRDPRQLINDILLFLNLKTTVHIDTTTHYMKGTSLMKSVYAGKILNSLQRVASNIFREKNLTLRGINFFQTLNEIDKPLSVSEKKIIKNIYEEDILKLQHLLGRNLSSWLENNET